MQWLKKQQHLDETPNWLYPLFFGLLCGILFIMILGERYLEADGILGSEMLDKMLYLEMNKGALLLYVLKQRMTTIFILVLLSSTFFGIIALYCYVGWIGFSAGVIFTVAAIRFGAKGILIMIASMFPHYIIYIPIIFIFLNWCYELCSKLYFPSKSLGSNFGNKKQVFARFFIYLCFATLVIILGGLLESYVNSYIIVFILKLI